MTKLESIIEHARSLSPLEFEELILSLSVMASNDQDEKDPDVGKRGLAALTESTREEDWSAFCSIELRNGALRYSLGLD